MPCLASLLVLSSSLLFLCDDVLLQRAVLQHLLAKRLSLRVRAKIRRLYVDYLFPALELSRKELSWVELLKILAYSSLHTEHSAVQYQLLPCPVLGGGVNASPATLLMYCSFRTFALFVE